MNVNSGIFLPQSTLNQEWFLILAMVVAFNTIIYLGLTIAKAIPWPDQIHPNRVRSIFSNFAEMEPPHKHVSRTKRSEI